MNNKSHGSGLLTLALYWFIDILKFKNIFLIINTSHKIFLLKSKTIVFNTTKLKLVGLFNNNNFIQVKETAKEEVKKVLEDNKDEIEKKKKEAADKAKEEAKKRLKGLF